MSIGVKLFLPDRQLRPSRTFVVNPPILWDKDGPPPVSYHMNAVLIVPLQSLWHDVPNRFLGWARSQVSQSFKNGPHIWLEIWSFIWMPIESLYLESPKLLMRIISKYYTRNKEENIYMTHKRTIAETTVLAIGNVSSNLAEWLPLVLFIC